MSLALAISIISLLFGSGLFVSLGRYLGKKIQNNDVKTEAVKLGLQALLRDRLYQVYNHYQEKGYAPIYAKENFENMYTQYHNLGANGVMDEIREKFKNLPTERSGNNED